MYITIKLKHIAFEFNLTIYEKYNPDFLDPFAI
jgi:hypothetical protein